MILFLQIILTAIFFIAGPVFSSRAAEYQWQEQRADHFIIHYTSADDAAWAGHVLAAAEKYYENIGTQLGFARYDHFWTWDSRTGIFVYPDQESFHKGTGQPDWASAVAFRDSQFLEKKTIVTFKQEDGFLNAILPHEIAHLILRDFMGFKLEIPLWFDEGIAQLQEEQRRLKAREVMKNFANNGFVIALKDLVTMDIRQETDTQNVALFYLQSISVVDYLINQYGKSDFARLCHEMKAGKSFEEALKVSYSSTFNSMEELQEKWLKYLSSN